MHRALVTVKIPGFDEHFSCPRYKNHCLYWVQLVPAKISPCLAYRDPLLLASLRRPVQLLLAASATE